MNIIADDCVPVWIDQDDNVVVTDFGTAISIDSTSSGYIEAPERPFTSGSAPQERIDSILVGVRTDSYGLGGVAEVFQASLLPEHSSEQQLLKRFIDFSKTQRWSCKQLVENCRGLFGLNINELDNEMSKGSGILEYRYEPETVVSFTNLSGKPLDTNMGE